MNIPDLESRRYTPTPHLGQTEELGADRTKSTPTISLIKMQSWKNTVQRPNGRNIKVLTIQGILHGRQVTPSMMAK